MTAGKFIISATPSAWRRRSTDSRSPIESGRRGDSKRLAGTHDDAITQTSSGTSSQTSSSQWMPSVPSTFAISCGSATTAVVPWASTARANSSTISFDDSMCTCASMKPGHEVAAACVHPLAAGVAAEPRDAPVGDRHVDVEPLLGEDREHLGVLDHEVGRDVTARDIDQTATADSLEHAQRPSVKTMSSGLTGTRTSATPVAARTAATMAGVDEIVGGSPTPLAP